MASFCTQCGKEVSAEGIFCIWCGKPRTTTVTPPMSASRGPSAPFVVIVIVIFIVGCVVVYSTAGVSSHSAADSAIASAVDACSAGSRDVLAEKIVDAERAIRDLPAEEQGTYSVKLDNQLRFIGCR
jgi:hypothetical protein